MKKSDLKREIANRFGGDFELAKFFCEKIENIEKLINELDRKSTEVLSADDAKSVRRALAKSYGEIYSEIKLPIYYKFPELDKDKDS